MTGFDDESPRPGIYPEMGRSTLGTAWAIGLSIAMVLVALLGAATMYVRPLYLASCFEACDLRLLGDSMDFYFVAAPIITIASLALVVLLRGRGRLIIIPAAVGLALVTGLFAASYLTSEIALYG